MKKHKVVPIKPELRGLLEEFLAVPEYQSLFKDFAKIVGYHGDNEEKIKQILFIPNTDGEIGFSIEGMYELFLEFQLGKQLAEKEPYASLLKEYPIAIQNIRKLAIKIYKGHTVDAKDVSEIFNIEQYKDKEHDA